MRQRPRKYSVNPWRWIKWACFFAPKPFTRKYIEWVIKQMLFETVSDMSIGHLEQAFGSQDYDFSSVYKRANSK